MQKYSASPNLLRDGRGGEGILVYESLKECLLDNKKVDEADFFYSKDILSLAF